MGTLFSVLLYAEAVMSLAAFAAYAADKRKAKRGAWRVPERTLLLLALLMGAPGALAGMRLFRHKTRHLGFTVLVPLFLALQIALIAYAAFQ